MLKRWDFQQKRAVGLHSPLNVNREKRAKRGHTEKLRMIQSPTGFFLSGFLFEGRVKLRGALKTELESRIQTAAPNRCSVSERETPRFTLQPSQGGSSASPTLLQHSCAVPQIIYIAGNIYYLYA